MKRHISRTLCLMAAAGAGAGAVAEPMGCLIEPDRVAEVGSASVGVIEHMGVERGDMVTSGQILARLSSGVERASMAVAETRATADAEVKAAAAAADLAKSKYERARDLVKENFISTQALEQAQAEWRVADERARQAREARDVAQREWQLSAAQLGQRLIRAPFDGIVVERYHSQGERIEREAVVKVAKIDPLRIEAIVPASQFGSIKPGQLAQVTPQLQQFGVLKATVTLVDRVIDAASNSFRVRLTLPNPDHTVPSGLRCSVDFGGSGATSASAAQPGVPARPAGKPASAAPSSWQMDTPMRSSAAEEPRGGVVQAVFHPAAAPVVRPAPVPAPRQAPGRMVSGRVVVEPLDAAPAPR